MERLFWISLTEKKDADKLKITTKSNKVYIGFVNEISAPIGASHIRIIPVHKILIVSKFDSAIFGRINSVEAKKLILLCYKKYAKGLKTILRNYQNNLFSHFAIQKV